ncbi:sensor histidine kinase, partial [Planomonospora corallina]
MERMRTSPRLSGAGPVAGRVLAHLVLFAVLGALYYELIGLGGGLAPGYGPATGLAAALAVGLLFHPLRLRLQRTADRLLKVERDPYRAADRLGRSMQRADGPVQALSTAVAAIRQTLRAGGVAVEVTLPGAPPQTVSDGDPGTGPAVTPLVWQGEPVGRLLIAGVRPEGELLGMLVRHLAEVAHAVQLTADLRLSRERILATREEERRRLRRDLHDGLGPALASMAMTVDEARIRLARDPGEAARLLERVRGQVAEAVGDVRTLVYGLRPPALDDLGLEGALRAVTE